MTHHTELLTTLCRAQKFFCMTSTETGLFMRHTVEMSIDTRQFHDIKRPISRHILYHTRQQHMQYVNPQGNIVETTLESILAQSPHTILYFYPKDNTPGCTIEAKDFSQHLGDFTKLGIQVIGVSKDSEKSHCTFQKKQALTIGLLVDTDTTLAQQFGAWGEKSFMGKKYMGVSRNTYLLDKKGTILYKRESVSAVGHVKEVLAYVREHIG